MAKQTKEKPSAAKAGCGAVVIVVFLAAVVLALWPGDDPPTAEETAACKADLACWSKLYSVKASVLCLGAVDRVAGDDVVWDDGSALKLQYNRWLDRDAGTLTYYGDKLSLPNTSGILTRHRFECDYDPATDKLTGFRIEPVL